MAIQVTVYYLRKLTVQPFGHIAVELTDETGQTKYYTNPSAEKYADLIQFDSARPSKNGRYEDATDTDALEQRLIKSGRLTKIVMPPLESLKIEDIQSRLDPIVEVALADNPSDPKWLAADQPEDEEILTQRVQPKQAAPASEKSSARPAEYDLAKNNCAHTVNAILQELGYKLEYNRLISDSINLPLRPKEVFLAASKNTHEFWLNHYKLLTVGLGLKAEASRKKIKEILLAEKERLTIEQAELEISVIGKNETKDLKIAMLQTKLIDVLDKVTDQPSKNDLIFTKNLLRAIKIDDGHCRTQLRLIALHLPQDLKKHAELLYAIEQFKLKGEKFKRSKDPFIQEEGKKIVDLSVKLEEQTVLDYMNPNSKETAESFGNAIKEFENNDGKNIINRHRSSILFWYEAIKALFCMVFLGRFNPDKDYCTLFPSKTKQTYEQLSTSLKTAVPALRLEQDNSGKENKEPSLFEKNLARPPSASTNVINRPPRSKTPGFFDKEPAAEHVDTQENIISPKNTSNKMSNRLSTYYEKLDLENIKPTQNDDAPERALSTEPLKK